MMTPLTVEVQKDPCIRGCCCDCCMSCSRQACKGLCGIVRKRKSLHELFNLKWSDLQLGKCTRQEYSDSGILHTHVDRHMRWNNHTWYRPRMGLPRPLLAGILAHGFQEPTDVQKRSIVPVASGRDCVVQAQSGQGKTGAFSIGLLARLALGGAVSTQALVLSPTQLLADQTFRAIQALGQPMGACVGKLVGAESSIEDNKRALRAGIHVAVGTPGRVMDLINLERLTAGAGLNAGALRILVVDEADQMLSQGFAEQLKAIVKACGASTQLAFFSATMPRAVVDLTGTFLRPDRVQVLVRREQLPLKGISTFAVTGLGDEKKVETLVDVLPKLAHRNVLVFTNTPEAARGLADRLRGEGLTCDEVHPRLDWREQADALARFRAGKSKLLVASGAFGRGLDIQNLGLVVNFELPRGGNAFEEYLHRVGRVGRCGRKGDALNLVAINEERTKRGIENHYSVAWEDFTGPAQLQG